MTTTTTKTDVVMTYPYGTLRKNRTTIGQAHSFPAIPPDDLHLLQASFSRTKIPIELRFINPAAAATREQPDNTQRSPHHFHQSSMGNRESAENQQNYHASMHNVFQGGVFNGAINFVSGG